MPSVYRPMETSEFTDRDPAKYSKFLQYATIGLSGMVGALIAIAWAPAAGASKGLGIILLGTIMGLLVGYRRRDSKFFFYLTLVCICALSSVISFQV